MFWFDHAVFYHIYPLGLCGAPALNDYSEPVSRLNDLIPWIGHIRDIGCNALYIGPLFQSVGHGYETTDYRLLDTRLGTNDDLKAFVVLCHENGIRVILDAVFNHTGRDFFAFRDLLANREHSRYAGWYSGVNFYGNNEYNDGFSYDNWGGYNLLVKLNLKNPEVRDYHLETVRFWVREFGIDGLRLDAADVLDFDFMHALQILADELGPDFVLLGEVIHGEYARWVHDGMLHSVTNYHLHKALYSAHNDHNYFEIAHTIRRQNDTGLRNCRLYNFADNHDVTRIFSRLSNKAHFTPLHILLYTLPGVPSIYYGSEYGIEGRKEQGSDAVLRPALDLKELKENTCTELIRALGRICEKEDALSLGDYQELALTTTQYAFRRGDVIIGVNNAGEDAAFCLHADGSYRGALFGGSISSENGSLSFTIPGCSGEIWIPDGKRAEFEPVNPADFAAAINTANTSGQVPFEPKHSADPGKPFEQMTVEELQAEVLARLAANGPVTDRMRQDVAENVYRDSLLNWVRSFQHN